MNIYDIKIGDTITVEKGLELARHFEFDYIVKRLEKHPENFKSFIFDGCSMLPDELMGLFTGCDWKDITYLCCLPHDIGHGYGKLGDFEENHMVNLLFKVNLINKAGMKSWLAEIFLKAVEIGGASYLGLSFSWGFARV